MQRWLALGAAARRHFNVTLAVALTVGCFIIAFSTGFWLLFRLGTGALRAGLLAAALLLSIEAVQLWMPARESTLTAPGLALLSAALVALLEPESGR